MFYAGDLKVYNPNTKKYSKVEGIHQVNGKGVLTYYIKADGHFRDAEQVYKHEKFHEIVDNNPELMGDLMLVLQMNYSKQEIARLVNQYIEAYEGIYGVYEEGMTEEALYKLEMEYLKEIFADVYGDIQRGKISTAMAKKAMGDQTDAVQRVAQNLRGIKNKKAPPKQSYMIEKTADGKKYVQADRQVIFGNDPDSWSEQLEDYINGKIRRGENVQLVAEDGDVLTLTNRTAGKVGDNHNSDGTTMSEDKFWRKVNAGAHIDELAKISTRGDKVVPDYNSKHGEEAAGGWNYRTAYFRDFDGKYYRVRISVEIGSDGNAVYNIGEMIERSFPTITGSSAKSGAQKSGETSFNKRVTHPDQEVKQSFSVSEEMDEAYLDAVEAGDLKTAQRMVDEAAKRAGYTQRAYHGTDADRFNVFDPVKIGEATGVGILGDGFYFADSKKAANKYGETVYDVYLKAENSYHASEADLYKIKAVELEKQGYDSVDLQTGIGKIIMVFDPQQIKSADPVTYDDDGNVIPLSERFNPEEVDIRYSMAEDEAELDAEYARKMAEDEEARRGKTTPEWERVRQSLDAYNAAAVEEKEKRRKKLPFLI